jgi:protein tyrosine phosphatase (PTP) superfamily phosphohydrolase (DUF442 family)
MRRIRTLVLALTPVLTPLAAAPPTADAAPALANARDPLAGVRTGGLVPDAPVEQELFAALAAEGFRVYIDLRAEKEGLDAARAAAEAAGLEYVSIPVGDEADLDLGSVRALDAVLDDPTRGPAVVACASGNRSGALLALRAFWFEGASAEEALELGKRGGLTRFEPQVRTLLGLPPLPPAPAESNAPPAAPLG